MKIRLITSSLRFLLIFLFIPKISFAGAHFDSTEAIDQAIITANKAYTNYASCTSDCEILRKQYVDNLRGLIYDQEASHVMTDTQSDAVSAIPRLNTGKAVMLGHSEGNDNPLFPHNAPIFKAARSQFLWDNMNSGKYRLDIGSALGDSDIYQSTILDSNSLELDLPTDGRALYVRLWTEVDTQWQYSNNAYTAYNSQNDLLKLHAYTENEIVPYGENMLLVRDYDQDQMALTPQLDTLARLSLPIQLDKPQFSLELEISDTEKADIIGIRFQGTQEKILLLLGTKRGAIALSGQDWHYSPAWKKNTKNIVVFSIDEQGLAQVVVNNTFAQSITLTPEQQHANYHELQINQMDSGYLYRLNLITETNPTLCTDSTRTSGDSHCQTGTTDNTPISKPLTDIENPDACLAIYQLNGHLHIPCVSVPMGFVDTQLFDIDLQQQNQSLSFALDLNTVSPADNNIQSNCITHYVDNSRLIIPCLAVGTDTTERYQVSFQQRPNSTLFDLDEIAVAGKTSESKVSDTQTAVTTVNIEGQWLKPCGLAKDGDFYDLIQLSFKQGVFHSDIKNYTDANCNIPLSYAPNPTSKGKYTLGAQKLTQQSYQAQIITTHIEEFNGSPFSIDEVDIFHIKDKQLYFGIKTGLQEMELPDSLSFERIYYRQ